ncbi:putative Xaa-Pro aminopeptidase P [Vitis vinifera]|uniref:Putative Xaa-Pro aminopeptidase P n=1 Tax=Vitis vinifera TaxID=29760 RepID=A0A438GP05_VITVI|nr:putative Xaa-Pro aminopeptidase P [Vitis vinifera]
MVIPVGEVEGVLDMAAEIGCKVGQLPTVYLGLPLGAPNRASSVWDGVEEKMKRKLALWKRQFLSKGGRITLIKSTLASIPLYQMSLFRMPKLVARRLEKIQRNFLWGGANGGNKAHLIKWEANGFGGLRGAKESCGKKCLRLSMGKRSWVENKEGKWGVWGCFPRPLLHGCQRNATVEDYWDQNLSQGGWSLRLLRDFNDWELGLWTICCREEDGTSLIGASCVDWVFPNSVKEVLSSWKGSFVGRKRKKVWKSIPLFIFGQFGRRGIGLPLKGGIIHINSSGCLGAYNILDFTVMGLKSWVILNMETMKLTEVSASDKLESFRASKERIKFSYYFIGCPNAAIIHYSPDAETCSELDPDSIYLFDSGAQYQDGTTDITRTVHLENLRHMRKHAILRSYVVVLSILLDLLDFMQVLKGHIGLGNARFPSGTAGHTLDILARVPLWKDGLDYRHGTGHGIGSYLNVHEGWNFGIRLENVLVIKEADTKFNFGDKGYLAFEHITWLSGNLQLDDSIMSCPILGSNNLKDAAFNDLLLLACHLNAFAQKATNLTKSFSAKYFYPSLICSSYLSSGYVGLGMGVGGAGEPKLSSLEACTIQKKLIDQSLLTPEEIEWVNSYHSTCRDILAPYLDESEMAWLKRSTEPLSV